MLSFIIPTRDRPDDLAQTLAALGGLDFGVESEVIIIDNASRHPPTPPRRLRNKAPVALLLNAANEGAAARNTAARAARHDWLIMLDDDSASVDAGLVAALAEAPGDVAGVGAEVLLPDGAHEAGGLPEVPIGCGVAYRRQVYLAHNGYDAAFHYYAEEYDLAARLLLAGHRIAYDARFRVLHRKVEPGRDFNRIVQRLVRNNAWVAQRYAPEERRRADLAHTFSRYRTIAEKERALPGYLEGLAEARATLHLQVRSPMPAPIDARFTGFSHALAHLRERCSAGGIRSVALVDEGKHAHLIRRALEEIGVGISSDQRAADAVVVATLSPGPMLDAERRWSAEQRKPVLTAWRIGSGDGASRSPGLRVA